MILVMKSGALLRSTNKLFVSSLLMSGNSCITTRKMNSARSAAAATSATTTATTTDLWILRHGQATHNPRAEAARADGCSFDEFLRLMEMDDSLDSELTDLGRQQAESVRKRLLLSRRDGVVDDDSQQQQEQQKSSSSLLLFDLVVSSPLSRAIATADLAVPLEFAPNRVLHESWREINGKLLNAKRRSVSELSTLFPHWNGALIKTEHDETWTPEELETREACRQRGYEGLHWILKRPENKVLLVCHGGILNYTMNDLPEKVKVIDGRRQGRQRHQPPELQKSDVTTTKTRTTRTSSCRFSNCELRRYRMEWDSTAISTEESSSSSSSSSSAPPVTRIILTELDLED
jgi:broad specificity phosphatase PhoE